MNVVLESNALEALGQTAEQALQVVQHDRIDEADAAERFAEYRTDLRAASDTAATALTRTVARLGDVRMQ